MYLYTIEHTHTHLIYVPKQPSCHVPKRPPLPLCMYQNNTPVKSCTKTNPLCRSVPKRRVPFIVYFHAFLRAEVQVASQGELGKTLASLRVREFESSSFPSLVQTPRAPWTEASPRCTARSVYTVFLFKRFVTGLELALCRTPRQVLSAREKFSVSVSLRVCHG